MVAMSENEQVFESIIYPSAAEYVVDTRPICEGMPFVLTDAAHPRLVLKHGSQFLIMDQTASIPGCNTLGYGYYRYDTRHISQWEMTINDLPPSLLCASVDQGYSGSFLYTNPQTDSVPQQKITLQRDVVLSGILWENCILRNYHNERLNLELKLKFQSDFADMFEVRGLNRNERGKTMVPLTDGANRSLFLAYRGLDNKLLETEITFLGLAPSKIKPEDGEVYFVVDLDPHDMLDFQICVRSRCDGEFEDYAPQHSNYWQVRTAADEQFIQWKKDGCQVSTDDQLFDLTVKSSMRDLYILRQPTPRGHGIGAGVPWYAALFGRDSAITAWQILPFIPGLSRECIEVLAAYQGTVHDDYREEAPGKIMHELRLGEMARTNQIPHTPYYGTVDATQLWLYVFCHYIDWSGDLDFARRMWPNVEAALQWLESSLVNGYIQYNCTSPQGLANQGWKDSNDSVVHENGIIAEPPIALCEAQGYLYACWKEVSRQADNLGKFDLARKLAYNADQLRNRFQRDFWMEDKQFVAEALDGSGKQVKIISSNPGHLLFTGILDERMANLVADKMFTDELYSGWGVRTMSNRCVSFNPMSYHNGTVWPHDNAIIAEGLRKIGRISEMHRIMRDLIEVTQVEPEFRLPELICGFQRERSARPIDYPVSCSPQAWASGSIFQLLGACLNLQADACNNVIRIVEPHLPDWLPMVNIRGLKVGNARLDLEFAMSAGVTSCRVLGKTGSVKVIVET